MLDIRAGKRAAEALRESEGLFRTLAEAAPIGIFLTKPTGECIYTNPLWSAISGLSSEESLGFGWTGAIHPDDREKVKQSWLAMAARGENYAMDCRVSTPAGDIRWVHALATPQLDASGSVVSYVGSVVDITERKRTEEALQKSEERFQIAAKATNDAIWDWDMLTNEVRWNDGVTTLFGYAAGEVGPDVYWWSERIHQEEQERILSHLHAVIERDEKFFSAEYRYRRADGSYASVLDRGYIVYDGQKNPVRMIGAMIDITQRKQAEEQLRALAAHIQSAREEERAQVAREIHDELGQALTGLKMHLSWLGKRLPKDQHSLPAKIKSMLKLIDTIIQKVRRLSTELRPGVLDGLGLQAAIEWQHQEFQNRTGIQCELSPHLEEIHLDRNRSTALFRIFQETLSNIANHARATRVDIGLEQENGNVTLEVKDNGCGIEETKMSDPKSLGLLGMRERALLLGGEVKIKGKSGEGTTVTVRIPNGQSGE